MSKKLDDLIDRFKSIEKEIVVILNQQGLSFDETADKSTIKKTIKAYIKKVNKAQKLFDEYELIAKQIEDLANDEGESEALTKMVLDFKDAKLARSIDISKNEKDDSDGKKIDEKKLKSKSKTKESVKEF